MPYTIDWFLEDRVFQLEIEGLVSIEELRALIDDYQTYIESGTPPVHSIIDVTRMMTSPRRIQEVRDLLPALNDEQVGWVVLISHNTFTNLLSSILLRFNGIKFRTFRSREDCLDFLNGCDLTLPGVAGADSA